MLAAPASQPQPRPPQVVVLALFSGMLFFQAPADANSANLNIRRGTCFISMMTNTLMSLGHAPQHFEDRLVFYKHTAMRFYRPVSYWLAGFLAGSIFNLAEVRSEAPQNKHTGVGFYRPVCPSGWLKGREGGRMPLGEDLWGTRHGVTSGSGQ